MRGIDSPGSELRSSLTARCADAGSRAYAGSPHGIRRCGKNRWELALALRSFPSEAAVSAGRPPRGTAAASQESGGRRYEDADRNGEPAAMRRGPELPAPRPCAILEVAVSAVVAGNRGPKIVDAVRLHRFGRLLRFVTRPGEVAVGQPRGQLVAGDRDDGRQAHMELRPLVVRGPQDGLGGDLGLEDGRY